MTNGIGVDVALEAVGSAQTVRDCIALPRRGGTAVVMGVASPAAEVAIKPYDCSTTSSRSRAASSAPTSSAAPSSSCPSSSWTSSSATSSPSPKPGRSENVRARNGIKTAIEP